ncbi:MAG: potassium transporter TrkG [Anaerolineae bacterium]|nr:Trk family potassium uptake protein [Anaerolineae bacterium]MDW8099627.1 potassium transporter TrkG [Anaerolineae bacterium]
MRASRVLVLGFAALISLGTGLLSLPAATTNRERLPLVDALFTATSAVCVTGLTVVDTGVAFSPLGQAMILGLIQVGGVGFVVMAITVSVLIGRRVGLRERLLVREALGQIRLQGMVRLVLYVIAVALILESAGATLLFLRWLPEMGIAQAAWFAVFHAISAFTNAGFDLFSQMGSSSLSIYRNDLVIVGVVGGLIALGSLGVTVLDELWRWPRTRRLSLHSRLVLLVSVSLWIGGALLIFVDETLSGTLVGQLPLGQRLLTAAFHSISARTGGFSTVPLAEFSQASLIGLLTLMFIGASTASMGGGVKTNTIGALLMTVWSIARGRLEVEAFGRTIPQETIYKALAVVTGAMLWVLGASTILAILEDHALMPLLLETVSAFGTVGYSIGITSELSVAGKLVIIATMFAGRLGPLTLVAALTRQPQLPAVRYPEEKILIG